MNINHIKELFKFNETVDNSFLVIFRFLFGVILSIYFFSLNITGWVKETFVDPTYIFPSISLDFLNNYLNGEHMYAYFALMSLTYLLFGLGFGGKLIKIIASILWTLAFLSQKSHYNNHYYLMVLISWLLVFMPTHDDFSLDNKIFKRIKKTTCLSLYRNTFVILLLVLYSYASLNKLYPGWLAGDPFKIWFGGHFSGSLGFLYKNPTFHKFIAISGILFDALIIPFLIFKRTRVFGVVGMILFHTFNGLTFHIGVFPFLSIATLVFFVSEDKLRTLLKRNDIDERPLILPKFKTNLLIIFLIIQVLLPLRQFIIKGNVFYTEEGQKLAWRMMLRHKRGHLRMWIVDNQTGEREKVSLRKYLSKRQLKKIGMLPEVVWQLAHNLKRDHYKDQDISIYANLDVTLNGVDYYKCIESKHDLLKFKYSHFSHNEFINSKDFNGIFSIYN